LTAWQTTPLLTKENAIMHLEQHEAAKKYVPENNDLNLCGIVGKCPPTGKENDKFDEDKFGGKGKLDCEKSGDGTEAEDSAGSSGDEDHDGEADLNDKKPGKSDEDDDQSGADGDARLAKKLKAENFDGNKEGKKPNLDGGMKSWMQPNQNSEPDFLEFTNPYNSYRI
jgi:hypothetical protein